MSDNSEYHYDSENIVLHAVLQAVLRRGDDAGNICGIIDLTPSGAEVRVEEEYSEGDPVRLDIADLRFAAKGSITRVVPDADVYAAAIEFNESHDNIIEKLFLYKLQSKLRL